MREKVHSRCVEEEHSIGTQRNDGSEMIGYYYVRFIGNLMIFAVEKKTKRNKQKKNTHESVYWYYETNSSKREREGEQKTAYMHHTKSLRKKGDFNDRFYDVPRPLRIDRKVRDREDV